MTSYTPDSKIFKDNWNLPDNPFPFLGADQYREEQILSLFEVDQDATLRSFSLQNSIIEGSFGTGKTMLLKAIYAFHYSRMILDIADKKCCAVIPVYIRFSDLPHNSDNIYRDLILNIYKKCLDTRFLLTSFLKDKTWFDRFKFWLTRLTSTGAFPEDQRYIELSSASVIKKVSDAFSIKGAIGYDWLQSLSMDYEKKYETEIIKKTTPGIADIQNLFIERFRGVCDRLLFLIDEVDRLPNEAFQRASDNKYSLYETFLNQLRTSENILYKVAVYPGTASSQQVEGSRIGTRIKLGFDVKDPADFIRARDFYYRILKSYLSFCAGFEVDPKIYFLIEYAKEPEKFVKRFRRE